MTTEANIIHAAEHAISRFGKNRSMVIRSTCGAFGCCGVEEMTDENYDKVCEVLANKGIE